MSPSDQPPPEPLVAAVPPRPGPHPTPVTRPYWEATTRHELLVQRCGSCDRRFHYPRSHCPTCWSSQLAWETASGGGVLVSATTIHRPGHPAFAAVAPYVVGLVDLDEGARLLANVDRPPTRELVVGERLALRWEDHGSYSLPWFHPVADPPTRDTDPPTPVTDPPTPVTDPPTPTPEEPG